MTPPDGQAGFTLVEVIVSLALFGLIALAGLAMVESVMGIREGTAGRLERLADIQRTLFTVERDVEQVAPGRIAGGGATLAFLRPLAAAAGLPVTVGYALEGGTMVRTVTAPGLAGLRQTMLPGVAGLRFRFWTRDAGWRDRWPADPAKPDAWPDAIAADIALAGVAPAGTVRRVVVLPGRP